jgi:hypothetical protein
MSEPRLLYFPDPAHKTTTTEAGPPAWCPDKEACPEDMTVEQRSMLVAGSVSQSGDPIDSVRYAVERVKGQLRWYISRFTRVHPDGRVEIHGHPFHPGHPRVPPRVLRRLRDLRLITPPEYRKLV